MRVLQRTLLPILLTMSLHAQGKPTTLAALRDQARPLLIFGGQHDTRIEQQYAILASHAQEARDRDMRVVLLTGTPVTLSSASAPPQASFSQDEIGRMRKRFDVSPHEFTVILVGKDGGEKLRSQLPIPWNKLASTVDAMPMRRDEMKRH